jgi:hypothetical protein
MLLAAAIIDLPRDTMDTAQLPHGLPIRQSNFLFRKIPMICSGVNRFLLISRPSFDPLLYHNLWISFWGAGH